MTNAEYRKAMANTFDPVFTQGYTGALLDVARIIPFAQQVCKRLTPRRLQSLLSFLIEHRIELRDNFRNFKLGYDKERGEWMTK